MSVRIIQNYSILWSMFRYSPHSHSRRTVYCGQKSFILPQSLRPRPIPIQDQMMRVRKSPFNALIKRAIDGQLTGSNAAPDFNCAAYFAYNFSQGIVYRACSRMGGRDMERYVPQGHLFRSIFNNFHHTLPLSFPLVAVYPMATSM